MVLQLAPGGQVTKKPWESKTLWAGLIAAALPLFPPAGIWIAANPEIYSAGLGALFAALRVITKGKVSIS